MIEPERRRVFVDHGETYVNLGDDCKPKYHWPVVAGCSIPRSFDAGAPVAAPSTHFPSSHSYGYASQSKHALRTTTEAPSSEIPVRDAG
jgi:hypothetical protein